MIADAHLVMTLDAELTGPCTDPAALDKLTLSDVLARMPRIDFVGAHATALETVTASAASYASELLHAPPPADLLLAMGLPAGSSVCALADAVFASRNDRLLTFALDALDPDERSRGMHLVRLIKTMCFLRNTPHVDAVDDDGFTRLSYSAAMGDLVSTHILLHNGALPTKRDRHGRSALHYVTHACVSVCSCWGIGCSHEPVKTLLMAYEAGVPQ